METKIFLENSERKKKAIGLIHRVYLTQLKNARKYTASTKTKSEVRGGGRKPWKQKGTGRARAGSSRSPLWVGGGVSFGPRPRVVSKKINKKERRLAIISAFYLKKKEFLFVEDTLFNSSTITKTKQILKMLKELNLNADAKILIILTAPNKRLWLATRNLKNIDLTVATCLNIKQLLKTNHIVLSNASLELINSTYGKQYA
jgi:large subunit ribosomal protein L4